VRRVSDGGAGTTHRARARRCPRAAMQPTAAAATRTMGGAAVATTVTDIAAGSASTMIPSRCAGGELQSARQCVDFKRPPIAFSKPTIRQLSILSSRGMTDFGWRTSLLISTVQTTAVPPRVAALLIELRAVVAKGGSEMR
jgi:hypothetical protein